MEMWYERHLRMRAGQPAIIRFLLWVGFVKFGRADSRIDTAIYAKTGELQYLHPEQIIWPFHSSPSHVVRYLWKVGPRVYVFRNLPGVIKRIPSRLLPMRWGFGVCGFEFGDRGRGMISTYNGDDWNPDTPLQTPVTVLDLERTGAILDMDIAMADPCPRCNAFRMRVGDWVCFGHCYPCEELARTEHNALELAWLQNQPL